MYMSALEYPRYSNIPQEMVHYWHAFVCTPETGASVSDEWNMYCMGHAL